MKGPRFYLMQFTVLIILKFLFIFYLLIEVHKGLTDEWWFSGSHPSELRNLPVKEFCYLRTINLTAAVYSLLMTAVMKEQELRIRNPHSPHFISLGCYLHDSSDWLLRFVHSSFLYLFNRRSLLRVVFLSSLHDLMMDPKYCYNMKTARWVMINRHRFWHLFIFYLL